MDMEYVDFDTFDALGMDVVLENGQYNLQIVFFKLGEDKSFERGLVMCTTIFGATVSDIAVKIQQLFDLNIFGNLNYLSSGHIITSLAELIDTVDWNEYLQKLQQTSTIIH